MDPEYIADIAWSNNPNNFTLETYFNPKKSSLGRDYKIKGLRPVIREDDNRYNWILTNAKSRWYVWEEFFGISIGSTRAN